MELIHGSDVTGYAMRYGRPPLDFSASLNPFGMPDAVRDAARNAIDASTPYPDPLCRKLTAALARARNLPQEFLLCGNGAADILYRLVWAGMPRTALVPVPSFAEYERALSAAGCRTDFHHLSRENGFALDEGILEKIVPGLDMLFLCQPNNPTGCAIEKELLSKALARCAETRTLMVVDECFRAFLDDPGEHSLQERVGEFDTLFLVDSFTKLYGMAGIRLGYGITCDRKLLEKMTMVGPPWPVSTAAQAAGLAALEENEYVNASLKALRGEKRRLRQGLEQFGFSVFGSDANYIFFHASTPRLDEALMRRGILIRNCGNFRGLEQGYYRIAVRLAWENERLLRAIDVIVNGQP